MADLNDIKLSAQDILKKKFRNKVKGYDPDEVGIRFLWPISCIQS